MFYELNLAHDCFLVTIKFKWLRKKHCFFFLVFIIIILVLNDID